MGVYLQSAGTDLSLTEVSLMSERDSPMDPHLPLPLEPQQQVKYSEVDTSITLYNPNTQALYWQLAYPIRQH